MKSRNLIPVAIATLVLAGCTDDGSGDAITTSTVEVPTTSTVEASHSAPTAESSANIAATASEACDTNMDLAQTDFGPFIAQGLLQSQSGQPFPFVVERNAFDACQDLSYAVISDSTSGGRAEGKHTGQALVLFNGPRLTTNYSPELVRDIGVVDRLSPSEIRVTWDDGNSNVIKTDGDSVKIDPDMKGRDVLSTKNSPNVPYPAIPQGNDHNRPYGDYRSTGVYQLPIATGQNLTCKFGGENQVRARCEADFPTTWKLQNEDHRQAEQVVMTTGPAQVRGEDHGSLPKSEGTIMPGTKTVVGGSTIVDLTVPGEARIKEGENGPAMVITADSYELQ